MRSNLKAYEIHTFQGGKWKIDSVFDDRELALFEAQRMDESGRHPGIRVIEEEFDENTQKAKIRTVFRGSRVAEANAQAIARSRAAHVAAQAKKAQYQKEMVRKRAAAVRETRRRKSHPLRLVALFTLITVFGLAAVVALSYFYDKI